MGISSVVTINCNNKTTKNKTTLVFPDIFAKLVPRDKARQPSCLKHNYPICGHLKFVVINGHKSDYLSITGSVPQGSFLGPLLFLLYINDLPNTLKFLSFHSFADDTNIYCSRNDLELILNQELHAVAEWMKSNRLALSILKTNFVLFHFKRLKPYKSLNLKIDGVNIQEVSTVKYLGVTFDSNLTWKNHVNERCLKLSKTEGIFSKLRYYINVVILIMLYYSLIYPFLTYGIFKFGVWHTQPTLNQ